MPRPISRFAREAEKAAMPSGNFFGSATIFPDASRALVGQHYESEISRSTNLRPQQSAHIVNIERSIASLHHAALDHRVCNLEEDARVEIAPQLIPRAGGSSAHKRIMQSQKSRCSLGAAPHSPPANRRRARSAVVEAPDAANAQEQADDKCRPH